MAINKSCLFCKIVAKEVPAHVVYEDEKTMGFLDVQPRTEGHVLLVPKYHAAILADLPESEIAPLFSAAKLIAGLLVKKLEADGLTMGINQGGASGQVVDHLHVHLLPRFRNDGGGSVQSVVNFPSDATLDEAREKIIKE